jgi:alkyl hydroperoxide reductase subunit AhpF
MILSEQDQAEIAADLRDRLDGPVGIELWTRRQSAIALPESEACIHCEDAVALARELVSLHPDLSFTTYDLDQHAGRAEVEQIERPPVTIVRAHNRTLQFVGYCTGVLFRPLVDAVVFASARSTPLSDQTRQALDQLPEPLRLDLYVAPYDPYSADMLLLAFALGIESTNLRVTAWEMTEFPQLASQRAITAVPALAINGRQLLGLWSEDQLLEQLQRSAAGDDSPVIRDHVLTTPLTTADQQRAAPVEAAPRGGGIFIPGRS